jgi:hypothetical protein
LPRAELARRLVGLALVGAGAIGLTLTVLDWSGVRDCDLQQVEGLLVLCASPLPSWLFGLWFLFGSLGTALAVRR